jgi:phosphoribosylglycinamide formyltransferase-1
LLHVRTTSLWDAGRPLFLSEEQALSTRIVALVSGSGTNLQALLDACAEPSFGATIVAVGADRADIEGLARAERAGVPTFVVSPKEHADRQAWDHALADAIAGHAPGLIVSAGFMRILGPEVLARFPQRIINTHPALLPSFPGAHGVRDALAYGAKLTGVTVHVVDAGVDTGPIVAQAAVPVLAGDDEEKLHERIKSVERTLLVETVGRLAREGFHVEGRQVLIP